jgi:hypothetical protein
MPECEIELVDNTGTVIDRHRHGDRRITRYRR